MFGGSASDASYREVESRFSKYLTNLCLEKENELVGMGMVIGTVGTHSFRKGIATFLSGMIGGPGPIAIYLRAGWSWGPVQSRYILEGEGGDQVCGRAATGLSLISPEVSSLPPHFAVSGDNNDSILTLTEWEQILPGYSSFYPKSFRPVIPFLLASLVFHQSYLAEKLPRNHALFTQRVWTSGILTRLKDKVLTGCGKNEVSKLCATGIPPFVMIAKEVADLRRELTLMNHTMTANINNLPEQLKRVMLENFRVDDVLPLTLQDIQRLLSSLKLEIISALASQITSNSILNTPSTTTSRPLPPGAYLDNNGYLQFTWGNRLHPVPEDFVFPRVGVTARTLWDLWYDGDKNERYLPYRKFRGFDINKKYGPSFCKARKVMDRLLLCSDPVTIEADVAKMEINNRDKLFEKLYYNLFHKLYPNESNEALDRRRIGDLTYLTVFDMTVKYDRVNGN
jgi:hypothetical protein